MERINHVTAVDIGGGRMGFRSKDTVAGVPGTKVTAAHLNGLQEEVLAVIEMTGQVPSGADWLQIVKGMRSQRLNWVAAANVGGTGNAITLTSPAGIAFPDLASLAFVPLRFLAEANNTGPVTIAVDGLAATALTWTDGSALIANAIKTGELVEIAYDGTAFRYLSSLAPSTLVTAQNAAASPAKLNFFEMVTQATQNVGSGVITVVTDLAVSVAKAGDAVFGSGGTITIGPNTAGVWVFSQTYVPGQIGGVAARVQAYLQKNGGSVQNQTVDGTFCTNAGSVRVAAGDTLRMAVWQNSGTTQKNQHPSALPLTTTFSLYQISS